MSSSDALENARRIRAVRRVNNIKEGMGMYPKNMTGRYYGRGIVDDKGKRWVVPNFNKDTSLAECRRYIGQIPDVQAVYQNHYFLDWLNHMSLNTDLCDDSKKFNKKVAGHKRLQRYRNGRKCLPDEEVEVLHIVYDLACSVNCNALKTPHPAAERGITDHNIRNLTVCEYQKLIHFAFEQYACPDFKIRQEKKLVKTERRAAAITEKSGRASGVKAKGKGRGDDGCTIQ